MTSLDLFTFARLGPKMARAKLEHNKTTLLAHDKSACEGKICSLHNRSAHSMRAWPQYWRDDRGLMERTCPHGVGHPDPDHMARVMEIDPENGWVEGVHGCDGCCLGKES